MAAKSRALQARSVVERAEGVLAEHGSLDMDEACSRLRRYAATSGDSLTDIAAHHVPAGLSEHGFTSGGVPVRNVARPVIRPAFAVCELHVRSAEESSGSGLARTSHV